MLHLFEFCPRVTDRFGTYTATGRHRIMTRDRAERVFARWVRRFGPGILVDHGEAIGY